MTNLDIIKYLATNNPARLAELIEDIYCLAWNDGANDKLCDESSIPNLQNWLYEDASKCGMYYHHELDKWNKVINPTYTIIFNGGKLECKDGKLSMQRDDCNFTIDQAIDEIKLLETITESDKYSAEVYDAFRREVCDGCSDPNCLRSQAEIYDCNKF